MGSRHRVSGVYIFFGILLAALAIFGCSGNGDDALVTGPGNYGSISGTVQAPAGGGAVRTVETSVLSAVNLANSYVFLEKYPQIATYANSAGNFTLSPVTFERHNVVVRLTGSDSKQYKVRSFNVDVSSSQPAKETGSLQVKFANRRVRVRVSDAGTSMISTATLTVWGETFTYIGNGEYESPVLPADETATITVNVAGRTEIEIPAQFVSTTPPVLETTVPPAGSTNTPPTVTLAADKLLVNNSGTIIFTATARDPENTAMVYQWETSSGSIATTSTGLQATWTAPSSGTGSATITFKAMDAAGLFARATLTVTCTAVANQKPLVGIIADSATLMSGTSYALTASATDPDGNSSALSYLWSLPADSGSLSTTTQNITDWTTPVVTATTSVIVTVTVTDEAGESTVQTRSFSILPEAPTPTAAISKPTTNQTFAAGNVQFVGQVRLSNNSVLPASYYHWNLQIPDGSTSEVAAQTSNFTLGLTPPGSYIVWLTATSPEGLGCSISVPFKINTPPQSVAIAISPNQASFIASAAVSFTGSATDPDGQTLSYAWHDYSQTRNATTTFATTQNVSSYRDFTPGNHTITLRVTDTLAASTSTSVNISIAANTSPAPVLANPPSAKTWYFINETVPFSGYATDAETDGGYVATESLSWEIVGPSTNLTPSATSAFSLAFENAGTYTIKLNAIDTQLATATIQRSLYINATPSVTIGETPASGTRYDNSAPFTLTADISDADAGESLSITWIDINTGVQLGNATLTGPWPKTHTLTSSLALSDNHDIIAMVTDSCGTMAVATRSLLINTLPAPGVTIDYPQYATAPGNIPVLLASPASQIDINVWATDSEAGGLLADSHIACAITNQAGAVTTYASGVVSLPLFLSPGRYQLMVGALDENGSYHAATSTFVVWNVSTYLSYGTSDTQLSSPTTLLWDGGSYYITDSGNSKLKKFTTNFGLESALGGPGNAPGSFTALLGVTSTGGKLYTLEGMPSLFSRIQVWSSLATESNYGTYGVTGGTGTATYYDPVALTANEGSLFLSEKGANRIQKLDLASGIASIVMPPSGTSPGSDMTHFNMPLGIRHIDSSIYVADYNNDRIVIRNTDLNYSNAWGASNPVDIANLGNYFISVDKTGSRLQFLTNSGVWQMDAGSDGSALGQFDTPASIVVNGDKVLVLENGSIRNQARVHVFTLPSSSSPW